MSRTALRKPQGVFLFNTECMKFLEKDLEEIIFTSQKNDLCDRGLPVRGKIMRQLRIGNYGVADLVTIERPYKDEFINEKGRITVYELKQDKIGISAFLQALGYVKGIRKYILKLRNEYEYDFDFKIVLVGYQYDNKSTFCYLSDFLNDSLENLDGTCRMSLDCYTYDFDINGIVFNEETRYSLIEEGF